MNGSKYPNLFKPLKVNNIVLKNRIISAPLGSLTDKSISGIGMIIRGTSGCINDGRSRMQAGPYCFEDIYQSAKVREQVSIIRQRGTKAEFELCHVGQFALVEKGDYAIGPVAYTREDGTSVHAMDEDMMNDIADRFAKGALDAKTYGFDMVMLHFGHGWLPAQFLSPYFNKRTDDYGGSFENRIKFPTMIVDRVRKAVGPDYALDMRISGYEHVEGGIDPEEVVRFVTSIEDKIDMVHISCGMERDLETIVHMSTTTYQPHQYNVKWAKKMKEAVHIPVAVVGAIMTPEEAEDIIASGSADAIVVGRQIIADPFWVTKAWEGRSEDITPCLRCLNCYNSFQQHRDIAYGMKNIPNCSVNPRYLHEDRVPVQLPKAKARKKVLVIGGGPAGIKAALTAKERGHQVLLLEKGSTLGGQLVCADYDKSKQDLKRYKDYLITQINKTNIEIQYNITATPKMIKEINPDTVILAIGAEPIVPPIKGSEKSHVMTAIDAYSRQGKIGNHVVMVGGGSIGCELGAHLAQQGKKVTIIELTDSINGNSNQHIQTGMHQILDTCPTLTIMKNTMCTEIKDNAVVVVKKDGTDTEIKADTVILAAGMKSKTDEANKFFGYVQDTNTIGDANRVGTIWEATHDGYYVSAHL